MKIVAVKIEGVITTHLPSENGNYTTLCGLDGDDPSIGQELHKLKGKAWVDCAHCTSIFRVCSRFSPKDFTNF